MILGHRFKFTLIVLLAGILVAAAYGVAGEAPDAGPRNAGDKTERPDVQRLVKLIEARYQSARTLRAVFLERYSEGHGSIRVESGTVYFSRPGRMRWEYEAPEQKLFLVDGKTAWFYVPADRTVTRAPIKDSADWRTPLALLTGKARLNSLCSRVEWAQAEPAETGHVVLRCRPRGESASATTEPLIHEVLLETNAQSGELARVHMRQAGGIELEYRFGDWQRDLPIAELLFHFSPPPGVAIIEESSLAGSPR